MTERPILFSGAMVRAILAGQKTQTRRIIKPSPPRVMEAPQGHEFSVAGHDHRCPYGQPGDRLWVKETHIRRGDSAIYRADLDGVEAAGMGAMYGGWKPSIFCKRIHSRLTLEITAVRVERLQDISMADAVAEGVEPTEGRLWKSYTSSMAFSHPASSYASLWESINGPGSWAKNPWVWVVEFKEVRP